MSEKLEALNLIEVDEVYASGIELEAVTGIYTEESEKDLLEAGFTAEEIAKCKFEYDTTCPNAYYWDLSFLASFTEADSYHPAKGFYKSEDKK